MEFDKNIIIKYFSGEASENEQAMLIDWLDQGSHNRTVFAEYKKIWLESQDETSLSIKKPGEAYSVFSEKIERNKIIQLKETTAKHSWLRYAANIILIMSVGVLAYYIGLNTNQNNKKTDSSYNEIIVPYGGISSVILPDKTKVWLHSGSKLKYKKDFGNRVRKIELEGEAYFDVAKNEKIPFIVKTSHIDIKVTGTSFNVKSYTDDDKIETTLEEGSINIISINGKKVSQPIKLKPKDKFTFFKKEALSTLDNNSQSKPENDVKKIKQSGQEIPESLAVITPNVIIEEDISWKEGTYILNNKSLSELTKILERRYNVEIVLNDINIKTSTYSGVLKDLTLEQVLNALKLTSEFDYTIDGRKVTLYMKD